MPKILRGKKNQVNVAVYYHICYNAMAIPFVLALQSLNRDLRNKVR